MNIVLYHPFLTTFRYLGIIIPYKDLIFYLKHYFGDYLKITLSPIESTLPYDTIFLFSSPILDDVPLSVITRDSTLLDSGFRFTSLISPILFPALSITSFPFNSSDISILTPFYII